MATQLIQVITFLIFGIAVSLTGANRNDRQQIRNGHPTDFLVSSVAGSEEPEPEPRRSRAEQQREVESMTSQLMEAMVAKGADPNRPSVRYILELFEQMELGTDLKQEAVSVSASAADAAVGGGGSRNGRRDRVVTGADVIRGLSPIEPQLKRRRHKADVSLNFPLSGLSDNTEQMELAELRIRPMAQHPADARPNLAAAANSRAPIRPARRSGLQRVRVSVLDKEGDRQMERIYRVRWRLDQSDDFDVLDVTRILKDMVASGARNFQNGSLEISLRKTRRLRGESALDNSRRKTRSVHNGEHVQLTENDAMMVVYSKSVPKTAADEAQGIITNKKKLRAQAQRALTGRDEIAESSSSDYEDLLRRRVRRGAGSRKGIKKNRCQPKDMYIDFEKIGWADDIVFPIRYNAKTCSGKCPSPVSHTLHPTNHAILKSVMRLYDRKVARPCCVPTKLKPLMMLYKLADGNVEIRHHPDMIVDQCGCR